MSRRCRLTGREPGFGRNVSHWRTSRRCDPDIRTGRYTFTGRVVRLTLCTDATRTTDGSASTPPSSGPGPRRAGLMARTSEIAKNEQRKVIVARYAPRRAQGG